MRPPLLLIVGVWVLRAAPPLQGQSPAEYLRRMDANRNGMIEPSEISDRARSYIERYAGPAGLRLTQPIPLSRLEAAARTYYQQRSGGSSGGSPSRGGSSAAAAPVVGPIPGFGPSDDSIVVPGFGPDVAIKYPFTQADADNARERLARDDKNRDGVIDRAEAGQARWNESDPFIYDFNKDGRLSFNEIAQRYARRRAAESQPNPPRSTASSTSRSRSDSRYDPRSRTSSSRDQGESRSGDRSRSGGGSPDRGSWYLAISIIDRYDSNRSGVLEHQEWSGLGENVQRADMDRDNQLSREEIAFWLYSQEQRQGGNAAAGLPDWFFDRDANADGQIAMSEFASEWTEQKADEFRMYDLNDDGVLSPPEYLESLRVLSGSYTNDNAMVIPARGVAVSEIEVEEDYLIADIDVQLSITHTYAAQLEAYLIGPDGQRIELFSRVGGSDDHFDNTILDDEAEARIVEARAPFRGKYQPASLVKREPSLEHFYGKSVKGIWQLMIRPNKSDRAGVLHGWSLIVVPAGQTDR